MTVLLYIMDSIFRQTFVPLAWLHYARGQQLQQYILNIEILEYQSKCNLRYVFDFLIGLSPAPFIIKERDEIKN